MKKSEIEAIPYCKHGNKEWYAGTKIAHLSDQNARIIDIFYQGQPVVRYVIGASQYLTYICTEKKWSQAKIKDEWSKHKSAAGVWSNYDSELGSARWWVSLRTAEMYKQLSSFFELGSTITMTINKDNNSDAAEAGVIFNNVKLTRNTFDGKFFADRKVTLEGIAPEGKVVTGWNVKTISTSGTVTETKVDGSRYEFVMPACSSIVINAILANASGINNVAETQWTWQKNGSQLIVAGVSVGTKIQLFDLRGMPVYSSISDGTTIAIPLNSHTIHVLKVGSKAIKL